MSDGQTDVWKATRKDHDKFWWENSQFQLTQVTDDVHVESGLRFTPNGQQLLFQQGRGDLAIMNHESEGKTTLVHGK